MVDDETDQVRSYGFHQTFWIEDRSPERATTVVCDLVRGWIVENDPRAAGNSAEVAVVEVELIKNVNLIDDVYDRDTGLGATGRAFYASDR